MVPYCIIFLQCCRYALYGAIWDKFALYLMQKKDHNFKKLSRNGTFKSAPMHKKGKISNAHLAFFLVQIRCRFNAHFI